MLSAEELVKCVKKPAPQFFSLGSKESELDTLQLEAKLANIEELLAMERVKMVGLLSKAKWCPFLKKAEVTKKVGSHWEFLGHSENKKTYLYPEEALYLVDIGALELAYNDVPMSVQRAYFLLTDADTSLEKYRVFSQLSLLGYKVMRHSRKNVLNKYEKDMEIHKIRVKHKDVKEHNTSRSSEEPLNESRKEEISQKDFPIVIAENDTKEIILKKLQHIGPKKNNCRGLDEAVVDFDVFRPGNEPFRKSTVQLPDFRIRVFSSSDLVPDLVNLCRQQNFFQDDVPFIHAIVHPDYTNFLQIASVEIPDILE